MSSGMSLNTSEGRISTFAVIDLPLTFRWPRDKTRKEDPTAIALEILIAKRCRLVSTRKGEKRLQIVLAFDSVEHCLLSIGEFGVRSFSKSRLALPARIGIATAEGSEDFQLDHPGVKRASWLAALSRTPAILLSPSTLTLAQDLSLFPYSADDFGAFYNFELGEMVALGCLTHPLIPTPAKPDEDSPRHNIPFQSDLIVDRPSELEEIATILDRSRGLNIVGGSGVGKSCLAQVYGLTHLEAFVDGVKYVDVSQVTDRSSLFDQIYASIGLNTNLVPGLNLNLLRRHFGNRRHLLIFDGCDHCQRFVLPVIEALLETPHVKILATSQSPINVPGCESLQIEDLSMPPTSTPLTIAELERFDATALIIRAINKHRPNQPACDSDGKEINEICLRANGNPLYLNLLARRFRTETLSEILASMQTPTLSERTMHSAVQNTLSRLTKPAHEIAEYSSTYVDPWPRNFLAEMVEQEPSSLTEPIAELVRLGVLMESVDDRGHWSYSLRSHFRESLRSQLIAQGRFDELREQHFLAFFDLVRTNLEKAKGQNEKEYYDLIDGVRADFEAGLRYLIETRPDPGDFTDAMRLSWPFWYQRNRLKSVINLATLAFEKCPEVLYEQRGRMLMLQGIFVTKTGDSDQAISLLLEALKLIKLTQNEFLAGQCWTNLGIAYWANMEASKSLKAFQHSLRLSKKLSLTDHQFSAASGISAAAIDLHNWSLCEKAIGQMEEFIEDNPMSFSVWNIKMGYAELHCETGQTNSAYRYIEQAMLEAKQSGDSSLIGRTHLWKSRILLDLGQVEDAARSLGACIFLMNSGEHSLYKVNLVRIRVIEERILQSLPQAKLNELRMEGAISI